MCSLESRYGHDYTRSVLKPIAVINVLLAIIWYLQPSLNVRIVYSYNKVQYDSVLIIVQHHNKTIHDKNYRLTYAEIDSTHNIARATPNDTFTVIIRGYKKHLYCIPFNDTLTYPYFRMSYAVNFDCIKVQS